MPEENLITFEEVAELFSVKPRTVRNWTSQKVIPFYKLNNRAVRYSKKEILEWANAQRVKSVGGEK